MLDGYPRADALQWAFDIDNAGFTDALAERGFDVATASHSDYLWTHLTLPSALNMAYVEQIPGMVAVQDGTAPRQPTLRWTVSNNPVFDAARAQGYTPIGGERRLRGGRDAPGRRVGRRRSDQRVRDQPAQRDLRGRDPESRRSRLRIGADARIASRTTSRSCHGSRPRRPMARSSCSPTFRRRTSRRSSARAAHPSPCR